MNLVFFASGNGSNFEAILNSLKETKCSVKALITDRVCNALNIAKNNNVDSFIVSKNDFVDTSSYNNYLYDLLCDLNPDYIILAGYMRIIPNLVVDKFPLKIINIHPSLLPAYKGKDAIKRAWLDNVKISGVSIHFVNYGVDMGPIINQVAVPVNARLSDFEKSIHVAEHKLYSETVQELINTPFNKLYVSKCLLGTNCRYDGGNKFNQVVKNFINQFNGEIFEICPELEIGLAVPREAIDYENGVFYNKDLKNLNNEYLAKFEDYYSNLSRNFDINDKILFILKENSPSCGVKKIGFISEKLRQVTNAFVVSEKDITC